MTTESTPVAPRARLPLPGEPGPWFKARSTSNENYHFDTVAGRYVVLCFFGSAGDAMSRQVLDRFLATRRLFDDERACFFGVSLDPEDERQGRVAERLPGIRHFWDTDGNVSRLYGRFEGAAYQRATVILDERLRIVAAFPFGTDAEAHAAKVLEILAALPPIDASRAANVPAPVLVVPNIFEPALCRRLIAYYEEGGAKDSGFMRDVGGKTVGMYDYGHKRRSDKNIDDAALRDACIARIRQRLVPEVHKAFQFHATRIERHIVACYEGTLKSHFRPHRDNTTKGTAHRRFAVSLVLNTGEFEGGQVRFPEFGRQTYSPPAGGAVVFSCSLLHEATPVTAGLRYCYLPFLYDDAAARIRQQNSGFLAGDANESPMGQGEPSA